MKQNRQSILVSLEPKLDKNGDHNTWEGRGSTYYTFIAKFENGDEGETSKKSQNPNVKLGIPYKYQIEEKNFDWGTVFKITGMADPNAEPYQPGAKKGYTPKGGGGYRKSPEEQKEIFMQVSMICANMIMNRVPDSYNKITSTFMDWLVYRALDPEYSIIGVQGVLKIACEHWNQIDLEKAGLSYVTLDKIIEWAEKGLIAVNHARTWKGSHQQKSSESSSETNESSPSNQQRPSQSEDPQGEDPKEPFMKIE